MGNDPRRKVTVYLILDDGPLKPVASWIVNTPEKARGDALIAVLDGYGAYAPQAIAVNVSPLPEET